MTNINFAYIIKFGVAVSCKSLVVFLSPVQCGGVKRLSTGVAPRGHVNDAHITTLGGGLQEKWEELQRHQHVAEVVHLENLIIMILQD